MMLCGTCREEVRFDWREGAHSWVHRDTADHAGVPVVPPEVPEVAEAIPEPEQLATPWEVGDLPERSGMKQIANLILKTEGWTLHSISVAVGPYLSATGKVLSTSESIVIRGHGVDKRRAAVASWRDRQFDFGYVRGHKESWRGVTSTDLKTFIKEIQ